MYAIFVRVCLAIASSDVGLLDAVKELERQRERAKKGKGPDEGKDSRDNADDADLAALAAEAKAKEDAYSFKVDDRFTFVREGERMHKDDLDYWIKRVLKRTGWKPNDPLIRFAWFFGSACCL